MNNFLDIHKTDAADLRQMISQARDMKIARKGLPKGTPDTGQPLANHIVALIFEKPSTRTRVSFDVGVRQMGGGDPGAFRQRNAVWARGNGGGYRTGVKPLC